VIVHAISDDEQPIGGLIFEVFRGVCQGFPLIAAQMGC
jgi:hypothetical protein